MNSCGKIERSGEIERRWPPCPKMVTTTRYSAAYLFCHFGRSRRPRSGKATTVCYEFPRPTSPKRRQLWELRRPDSRGERGRLSALLPTSYFGPPAGRCAGWGSVSLACPPSPIRPLTGPSPFFPFLDFVSLHLRPSRVLPPTSPLRPPFSYLLGVFPSFSLMRGPSLFPIISSSSMREGPLFTPRSCRI